MSLFRRRSRTAEGSRRLRLFVAADIHGSDVCWKKFLNAGKFYGVDALVLAGDLTGKALVPVIEEGPDRYRVRVMGRERIVDADELEEVERLIRFNGFYPYRCEPDEVAAMRGDEAAVTGAFRSAMHEQLERWVALADDRLRGTGIRAFVMPGNDDEAFVATMLDEAPVLENQDGRVIDIEGYAIVGQGWSNATPWDTPREKSEDELEDELMRLLKEVDDPRRVILNPHVPPHDTGLDAAPELDENLQMVARSGQPNFIPVGSTGVRRVIEAAQPLVSLSGHIHESKGVVDLSGTTCINPGSEYNLGRLLGAIVELRDEEVRQVQLVTG